MKPEYNEYAFSGQNTIPAELFAASVVDQGLIGFNGENVVRIRMYDALGVYSSDDPQNLPSSTFVRGTVNYNGLRRVHSRVTASYILIFAPYVAETLNRSMTMGVGFESTFHSEFAGFSLHLGNACTTSEILEIVNHSVKGAAYDSLIWSKDMDGVQDDGYRFNPPIYLAPGDRLELTWENSQGRPWGISLFIRKLR